MRFFGVNFILQKFARVKKMTNMRYETASKNAAHSGILKIRNDAYGECELYGGHLVQVRLQMP